MSRRSVLLGLAHDAKRLIQTVRVFTVGYRDQYHINA
jgi:hypothetical protein